MIRQPSQVQRSPGIRRAPTVGQDGRHLVGDAISLADICFVAELCLFSNERPRGASLRKRGLVPVLADGWREAYPRASGHLDRLSDHPAFAPDVRPYLKKLEALAT